MQLINYAIISVHNGNFNVKIQVMKKPRIEVVGIDEDALLSDNLLLQKEIRKKNNFHGSLQNDM